MQNNLRNYAKIFASLHSFDKIVIILSTILLLNINKFYKFSMDLK